MVLPLPKARSEKGSAQFHARASRRLEALVLLSICFFSGRPLVYFSSPPLFVFLLLPCQQQISFVFVPVRPRVFVRASKCEQGCDVPRTSLGTPLACKKNKGPRAVKTSSSSSRFSVGSKFDVELPSPDILPALANSISMSRHQRASGCTGASSIVAFFPRQRLRGVFVKGTSPASSLMLGTAVLKKSARRPLW